MERLVRDIPRLVGRGTVPRDCGGLRGCKPRLRESVVRGPVLRNLGGLRGFKPRLREFVVRGSVPRDFGGLRGCKLRLRESVVRGPVPRDCGGLRGCKPRLRFCSARACPSRLRRFARFQTAPTVSWCEGLSLAVSAACAVVNRAYGSP